MKPLPSIHILNDSERMGKAGTQWQRLKRNWQWIVNPCTFGTAG